MGMFEIYAIVQQFYAHRPCDTPKCDMNTLASAHVTKKNKMGEGRSFHSPQDGELAGPLHDLRVFAGLIARDVVTFLLDHPTVQPRSRTCIHNNDELVYPFSSLAHKMMW